VRFSASAAELVELVTHYLDGVLPADLRDDFQTHLSSCDGCDEYVRQLETTIRTLRDADLQLVPLAGVTIGTTADP
jgi:anti-sigma factor RsiW